MSKNKPSGGKSGKYYQGRYKPINPTKYKGDPTDIIYRSGWELRFMRYCDTNTAIIEWNSECIIVPYRSPLDDRIHRYFPDFWIRYKTHDNVTKQIMIEVKPHAQQFPPKTPKRKTKRYINAVQDYAKNQAKWKAAREFCANAGMEFQVLTEKHLKV